MVSKTRQISKYFKITRNFKARALHGGQNMKTWDLINVTKKLITFTCCIWLTNGSFCVLKPSESETNARESVQNRPGDEIKFIWYRMRCEESVMGQYCVEKTPTSVCWLKARRERAIVRHLHWRLSCGFVYESRGSAKGINEATSLLSKTPKTLQYIWKI